MSAAASPAARRAPPPAAAAFEALPAPEIRSLFGAVLARAEAGPSVRRRARARAGAAAAALADLVARAAAEGRSLRWAVLPAFDSRRRDLSGLVWDGALLPRARLDGSVFRGGSFQGLVAPRASGRGCDFAGCDLTDADLGDGDWRGAVFAGATLCRTRFAGSLLDGADFRGAGGTDVMLARARCRRARFDGGRFPQFDLTEADAAFASFVGANAEALRAPWSDLRGTDWRRAMLGDGDAHGADLRRARLDRAWAPGLDLRTADLRGATGRGLDARLADLREAATGPRGAGAGAPFGLPARRASGGGGGGALLSHALLPEGGEGPAPDLSAAWAGAAAAASRRAGRARRRWAEPRADGPGWAGPGADARAAPAAPVVAWLVGFCRARPGAATLLRALRGDDPAAYLAALGRASAGSADEDAAAEAGLRAFAACRSGRPDRRAAAFSLAFAAALAGDSPMADLFLRGGGGGGGGGGAAGAVA